MTGSFVVQGVLFLKAIGLPRDLLVQAMGMLFLASTLALGLGLGGKDFLRVELGLTTGGAVVLALLGLGNVPPRRGRQPEGAFRHGFLDALLRLSGDIVAGDGGVG